LRNFREKLMRQTIRIIGGILWATVAVFLFAGAAFAQGAQTSKACSLLTKAEIQAVLGQSVSDGKLNARVKTAVAAPCNYVIGSSGGFNILVRPIDRGETADKLMEQMRKMKVVVSDAPGIGDRSFFSSPGIGVQLNTFKGSSHLIITLVAPKAGDADMKAAAEKLMRKALTRI
jgi:hypothetical protein